MCNNAEIKAKNVGYKKINDFFLISQFFRIEIHI